jgi:hypothetical protein
MPVQINITKRERTIINPFTGRKVDRLQRGLVDDGIYQQDLDSQEERELLKEINAKKDEKGS